MALSSSTLLTLLDSMAKGVSLFESSVGVLGSEANTVSKGAANNVATLAAVSDITVQADLGRVFQARATAVRAAALYRGLGGSVVQRALDRHYGESGAGSLNAFLTSAGIRVHPDLRKIGMQVDAVNAFAATAVDPMASFAVTGSGAGTYTAGTDIDTTLYGKANLVVKPTALVGAATITATLTLRLLDGSQETKTVSLPSGTASGTAIEIGTPGTDMYVGVDGISITGGTNGDAFKVVSTVERTVTL